MSEMQETAHVPHDMQESPHSVRNYLLVFGGLGVLTAIEIIVAISLPESIRIPFLLGMALLKAALVALFYMHLKNDSRIYAFFFVGAIFLLAIPFVLALLVMTFTME